MPQVWFKEHLDRDQAPAISSPAATTPAILAARVITAREPGARISASNLPTGCR
jgi:hypothetical protein